MDMKDITADLDAEKAEQRAGLLALINGCWTTQAIVAGTELGIAPLLAAAPREGAALAEATGCHAPSLLRLLHAWISLGLCTLRDDGCFALTPLGRWLDPAETDSLDAWARLRALRWNEWGEFTESVRSGESFQKRHAGRNDFARLEGTPHAALFHRAMVGLTRRVALGVAGAVEFAGSEALVDIGGGSGELLAALVARWPAMHGVVLDLAHARDSAIAHLAARGLGDRCAFEAGSFFDSWPRGDVYLLKSVLHNWDDERVATLLRLGRDAMELSARMLIVERLLPERWADTADDRAAAASDLNMLVTLSGRERTEAQFRALLAAAGLRVDRVVSVGAGFHVIEARREIAKAAL